MGQLKVYIKGISPLLMHSTAGMSVNMFDERRKVSEAPLTGLEEAEKGAYRTPDGCLALPSIAFARAMFRASSGIKVGKLTARAALSGVAITTGEYVTLRNGVGEPIREFTVDTRFVVIQRRGRVPRSRARVDEWSAVLDLEYDGGLIDEGTVVRILAKAGKTVGVGDYRPETGGGPFGRFEVSTLG